MNRNQSVGIFLAGLWLASLSPAGASITLSSFSGNLAPGNWSEQEIYSAHGAYDFSSATRLQLSASADNTPSDISLTSIPLTTETLVSFDWSVTPNGGITPLAYCFVGSTQHDLIGASGVLNLDVNSGTTISFELASTGTTPDKAPVVFEVDVVSAVPEAGTWLAGAFVLGVLGFEGWRRKSGTPTSLTEQPLGPIGAAHNRR